MPKRLSCKAEVATNYSCWGEPRRSASALASMQMPHHRPLLWGGGSSAARRLPGPAGCERRRPTALGRRSPDGSGRAKSAAGPGRRKGPARGGPARRGERRRLGPVAPGEGSASLSASLMSSPCLLPVAGRRTRVSLLIGGR